MAWDVVVVGGGIAGMSAAWRLSQRGVRVAVLEAARVGGEASWAAAGMLAPAGEIDRASPWAAMALASRALYPAFVDELRSESGLPIDFATRGALEVALSNDELTALHARAARQQEIGILSQSVTPSDAAAHCLLLTGDLAGARFYPGDAAVSPRDLMAALLIACRQRGVDVHEGARVERIQSAGASVRVETAQEAFDAGRAVLAAGAWSSAIAVTVDGRAAALPRAYPVRGHLTGYALEAASVGPIVRHGHTYLVQRSTGFTIAGTSSEQAGFDRTPDPAALAGIRQRAVRLLPSLGALEPAAVWLGFRPAIDADEPAIGPLEGSRVWLAYGHYRNGILLAPATAARLCDALA